MSHWYEATGNGYLFLNLASILLPVHPAAGIFGDILVANLLGELSSSTTPHTSFAVEDQLLVSLGLCKSKLVFEFVAWHEQSVGSRAHGDVDGTWDIASLIFGRFTHI